MVCPDGRNIENYNGTISISDTGIPCANWSEIDPIRFSYLFVQETQGLPNNYCRDISGEVKCIGYWSGGYQGLESCARSICGGNKILTFPFREFHGFLIAPVHYLL